MACTPLIELLIVVGGNIYNGIIFDVEIAFSQENRLLFPCSYLNVTGDVNHPLPDIVA